MQKLEEIIAAVDGFVWGIPLIVLILGVGIYLTVRLVFLPVRKLGRAFKYMFEKEEGAGEVSSFGALCTALSATIGTGNIVGVATAICAGGPGALFWMWLAAFFGMATKYAEGLLAVKYRKVYPDGHTLGGPFYYDRKRTRQTLEVPRRHLCRARHVRRAVRHRHLLAGQLHHGRGEQRV